MTVKLMYLLKLTVNCAPTAGACHSGGVMFRFVLTCVEPMRTGGRVTLAPIQDVYTGITQELIIMCWLHFLK